MKTTRHLLLVACIAGAGCGGSSPVAPTVASAPVASLSITSTNAYMYLGASETFAASAALSTGAIEPAIGTWGSDAPSIATVDAAGRVTAVAPGEATVYLDTKYGRATRRIRVVPDYRGTWTVALSIDTCKRTGGFSDTGFCRGPYPASSAARLLIQQVGEAAQVTSDEVHAPTFATGSISLDGHLAFVIDEAENLSSGDPYAYRLAWQFDRTFAGTITERISTSRFPGEVNVTFRVLSAAR